MWFIINYHVALQGSPPVNINEGEQLSNIIKPVISATGVTNSTRHFVPSRPLFSLNATTSTGTQLRVTATPIPNTELPIAGGTYPDAATTSAKEQHLYYIPTVYGITGKWTANDGGTYYVRQLGNVIWWLGMTSDDDGRTFTNVFKGTIQGNNITGDWSDVSRGATNNHGILNVNVRRNQAGEVISMQAASQTGGFGGTYWRPAPIMIDFEDLPVGSTPSPLSTGQKGIIIDCCSTIRDFSGTLGFAHSGTKGLGACGVDTEFCNTPITITFNTPQKHVQLWVGYSFRLDHQRIAVLHAYDVRGTEIGEATARIGPSPESVPISIPLEVSSQTAIISRVDVGMLPTQPGGIITHDLVIDDIEFDTVGAPPPCLSTLDPVLEINNPVNGRSVSLNGFFLDGIISSDAPIYAATLSVTSSTGSTNSLGAGPIEHSYFGSTFGEMLFPGSNTIRLKVQNCHGTTEASRIVTYSPITAGTKILFLGMDITQIHHTFDDISPLTTAEPTFVRVYLSLAGQTPRIGDVTGFLEGSRPLQNGKLSGPLASKFERFLHRVLGTKYFYL
jgi:hypothetical protein